VGRGSSTTDGDALAFTLIKQANGTYKIVDDTGLYLSVSDAKIESGSNIILWTETSDDSQTFILEEVK
jgi:hypothetical protein